MKVFIAWSGDRGKQIALALRALISSVIQAVEPWVSETEIRPGARWRAELYRQLEEITFGIIVLTAENMHAPWINFEAGALSKKVGESSVCPYLVGIPEPADVTGPLEDFQMLQAGQDGTLTLLREINGHLSNGKLEDGQLVKTFGFFWPELDKALKSLPFMAPQREKRDSRELLEEILERVRTIERVSTQQSYESLSMLAEQTAGRLATLPPHEEQILRMLFGIDVKDKSTIEEVAKQFNISQDEVREIRGQALYRMRHSGRRLDQDK
jgi:hypothetical protein